MLGRSTQRCRVRIASAVLVAAALGAAVACVRSRQDAEREASEAAGVYVHESAGFRYEFHAPTGSEHLYDVALDPHGLVDVLRSHEAVAARCRRAIAERVGDLDALRGRYAEDLRRLKELGYL